MHPLTHKVIYMEYYFYLDIPPIIVLDLKLLVYQNTKDLLLQFIFLYFYQGKRLCY